LVLKKPQTSSGIYVVGVWQCRWK